MTPVGPICSRANLSFQQSSSVLLPPTAPNPQGLLCALPLSLQIAHTAEERVPGEGTVAGSDAVKVGEELSYLR